MVLVVVITCRSAISDRLVYSRYPDDHVLVAHEISCQNVCSLVQRFNRAMAAGSRAQRTVIWDWIALKDHSFERKFLPET